MSETAQKEITTEELVEMNMKLRSQLDRQTLVNQKLREQIGQKSNELAEKDVTFDQMHAYALQLEDRISELQTPQPNREAKRAAKKGAKVK